MYGRVTPEEFAQIEGLLPTYMRIDSHLEALGGPGWQGFGFKVRILKSVGYDVDHPPRHEDKAAAYNKIGSALNNLGAKATAGRLCAALNIPPIPLGSHPRCFSAKQLIQTLFGSIHH